MLFWFSEVGKKGIELPNIPDVHYVSPVLHVMQVRDGIVLPFTSIMLQFVVAPICSIRFHLLQVAAAPHLQFRLCYNLLIFMGTSLIISVFSVFQDYIGFHTDVRYAPDTTLYYRRHWTGLETLLMKKGQSQGVQSDI